MRLIDADALKKYGTVIAIVNGQKMKVVSVRFIDNAPTVIPEDFMKPYEEGYERARKDFERPTGE